MSPNEDDCRKRVWVLRYIRGNLHMTFILWDIILDIIKCWTNASFAAQPDLKGNTGTMISMGPGLITELSQKKDRNVRRSI